MHYIADLTLEGIAELMEQKKMRIKTLLYTAQKTDFSLAVEV
jgi:hypothetical protein